MKERLISPAVYVQALFFFIGVWLVIAPFAMGTQPISGSWQDATINDVAVGGVLILLSLLGTLIPLAMALNTAVKGTTLRSPQEDKTIV
jgi:hypothetical protein